MIGKVAIVSVRDVGKLLRSPGAGRSGDRHRSRSDLCAPGGDVGVRGQHTEAVLPIADIFITTTGNKDIILAGHMELMAHQAIVGNIGHFDNEIDMAGLSKMSDIRGSAPSRRSMSSSSLTGLGHRPGEGRLLNLGNATGHPSSSWAARSPIRCSPR